VKQEGSDEAERLYLRALETSRQQGAIAWELRAALSLAGLWIRQRQRIKAAELLSATCERAPPDAKNASLERIQRLREQLDRA